MDLVGKGESSMAGIGRRERTQILGTSSVISIPVLGALGGRREEPVLSNSQLERLNASGNTQRLFEENPAVMGT